MIRVYFLKMITINGSEQVAGSAVIHDAVLDGTEDPDVRKLIMDTTPSEHDNLAVYAIEIRDPTPTELDFYNAAVEIKEPDPDTIRAQEILASSPDVISMPEMWELMRIFGRRLGYRFD